MKAKIDLEKFICSLMKRFYKIHNIDPLTTKCWLDKVLEDQGLEYRDGEIVEIPQDSEDERRKKEILDHGNQFKEIKDWLEYKPQGKSALEAIKEEKSPVESLGILPEKYEEIVNECIYGEEKPADKVEPKFKVKYAGSEYNVFETKDIAGVTFYGIEDEPNHIDYVKAENCEIISVYAIKENGSPYPTKPAVFSEKKPKRMISAEAKEAMYDKPACAWSEEDELVVEDIEEAVINYWHGQSQEDLLDWLKSLKQRINDNFEKTCKNDTLLDLLNKMPSCITVDGIDYHFVMKKTIAFMAFYEGEGEGSGKVIFWMTAFSPIDLLNEMLEKLKKKGLLE